MGDSREQRAALESAQTELREVRAALAVVPDLAAIRSEADRLIEERRGLMGTLDGLRNAGDHARIRVLAVKTERPQGLSMQLERFGLALGFGAGVLGGAELGWWLETAHFPPWASLAVCAGAAIVAFRDLTGFVRWLKT